MNREGSIFFHFSNRQEALFEFFIEQIKRLGPFDPVSIVVPSLGVKNTLKNKLAKELGISMGERFYSMQPFIHHLIQSFFPDFYLHSHLELALEIERVIRKKLLYEGRVGKIYEPLAKYLFKEEEFNFLRLTELSDYLSSLFVTYSLYGLNLQNSLKGHWQYEIWKETFKEGDYYFNPYRLLEVEPKPSAGKINLFIYNPQFMPRPYFSLLKKLSLDVEIHFFQFSPSCFFWSDLQTDFEKNKYLSKLREKQISEKEIKQLEQYLESNSLLANNAKLKREWFKVVEEEDFLLDENYLVCSSAVESQEYGPYYDASRASLIQEKQTLLRSIQTDILLMVPLKDKLPLSEVQSLQIHQASTFQREVEILHQNLKHLFETRLDIEPKDVVIYAPDPEKYIPYLDFVFNQKQSDFKISLFNVPFKTKSSALKGFLMLIDLAFHRTEASKLLELFHHQAFKDKFNVDSQMLHLWERWISEVGVSFGFDQKDQEEKLVEEAHQKQVSSLPNWRSLIESLLKFACQKPHPKDHLRALSQVDFSQMDSINLLAEILSSLKEDLSILSDREESFAFWANYTRCLLQSYFLFEKESEQEAQIILSKIDAYQSYTEAVNGLHKFKSFFYYLKKDLDDLEKVVLGSNLNCLSFYSLSNGPLVGSKVTYILGLNDLEFPRFHEENPLNLLDTFQEKNYCPKLVDYDRYLFLEFLLSAKDILFLSYLGYCGETFKEMKPSLLIEELLSYLDSRFSYQGHLLSEIVLRKHPHLSFNKQYFNSTHYNDENFLLAKSYYSPLPALSSGEVREAFLEAKALRCGIEHKQNKKEILISELFSLAHNPIQFSLNHVHQIYLEPSSIAHENQNYSVSFLQKAIYKRQLFSGESLEQEEGFPKGVFKSLANEAFEKEEEELRAFLKEAGLAKEDFFSVEFRQDVEHAFEFRKGHWIVPKLKVELFKTSYELVGLLDNVSQNGLLSSKDMSPPSFFAEWPKYLLFLMLKECLPFPLKEKWIFSKSKDIKELKIENPENFLKKYLEFYFLSLSYPLPFLPSWIPYFYKLSPAQMRKKVGQELSSPYFYNAYAKALFDDKMPEVKVYALWKELAVQLFDQTMSLLEIK